MFGVSSLTMKRFFQSPVVSAVGKTPILMLRRATRKSLQRWKSRGLQSLKSMTERVFSPSSSTGSGTFLRLLALLPPPVLDSEAQKTKKSMQRQGCCKFLSRCVNLTLKLQFVERRIHGSLQADESHAGLLVLLKDVQCRVINVAY